MPHFNPYIHVSDQFCVESKAGANGVIVFGASGDLTARKLLPALLALHSRRLVCDQFYVLGCGRTEMTDEAFREHTGQALDQYVKGIGKLAEARAAFLDRCYYVSGNYKDNAFYTTLKHRTDTLDHAHQTGGNHLFYLSLPPSLYSEVTGHLSRSGLSVESPDHRNWARVIIEKPFGTDLDSAADLDKKLHRALDEHQIYRIDHYLGKETVQNIMMFRFANAIFEPLLNRRYIDNVQITVAESIGVGDRAGYFEQAGMMRDMFQNHMMQMLAMIAMEAPASFTAENVRDEKVKLLRSIRRFDPDRLDEQIVRGQYGPGEEGGTPVKAYREETDVPADSMIETYLAARLFVDNWRWQGVPFYLRTGKHLTRRVSEIAITFKPVPHSMFAPLRPEDLSPNMLVLNVQPDEGISLRMQAKHPGPKLCMSALDMDFKYSEVFEEPPGDAYERLLLDAMLGDQTLFVRSDDMREAWSLVTPVLEAWAAQGAQGAVHPYPPGSWGPAEANRLLEADGRQWRDL